MEQGVLDYPPTGATWSTSSGTTSGSREPAHRPRARLARRAAGAGLADLPRRRPHAAGRRHLPGAARPAPDRLRARARAAAAGARAARHRRGAAGRDRGRHPRAPRRLPRARPVHCTSGTTGTPKGVSSGLLDDAQAAALVAEERALWGFAAADTNLVLSPLHHSAPLRFAMGTRLAGGRVVVPGPFDPGASPRPSSRSGPTTMFCVPTHLQRLLAHWERVGVPDLTSFRLVAHAGAPCPPWLKRRLVELFPRRLDVGVLRLDRGPAHRLPQRGVARAARHGGPRPARAHPGARRRRHHLVRRPAARPVHLLRRAGEDRRGLARDRRTGRPSRSATWAASTRTATSTSTAGARTS